MSQYDFEITAGNHGMTITATLKGDDGLPVDLSNADVTFVMGLFNDEPVVDQIPADKDPDQTTNPGVVSYTFTEGDTLVPGLFLGYFIANWPNGTRVSFPTRKFYIKIRENLEALDSIIDGGTPSSFSSGFDGGAA